METIDLRRVTEIHFHRSLPQLCVNRGTVGPEALPAVWHGLCNEASATCKCDDPCAICCQELRCRIFCTVYLVISVKALAQTVHLDEVVMMLTVRNGVLTFSAGPDIGYSGETVS